MSTTAVADGIGDLWQQVEALRRALADVSVENARLADDTRRLAEELTRLSLELALRFPRWAVVDLSEPGGGYAVTHTDQGMFLISLLAAERRGDACRLVLSIGNPQNMTCDGFELRAEWGRRLSQTLSFTATLHPGSWTDIEAVLAPVADSDRLIRLALYTNVVSLIHR